MDLAAHVRRRSRRCSASASEMLTARGRSGGGPKSAKSSRAGMTQPTPAAQCAAPRQRRQDGVRQVPLRHFRMLSGGDPPEILAQVLT